jgi:hypothetical protein
MVALGVLVGVATLNTKHANAGVALSACSANANLQPLGTATGCLSLTVSGQASADFLFPIGAGFIDVSNGLGIPINITGIQVRDGASLDNWSAVAPASFPGSFTVLPPTCSFPMTLAAGGHCSLYLTSSSPG